MSCLKKYNNINITFLQQFTKLGHTVNLAHHVSAQHQQYYPHDPLQVRLKIK